MNKRPLGRSGIEIAPLIFGGNVFGWTADKATSHALLDRFVAAGLDAIDTADVYSRWVPGNQGGESETIIGDWLAASPRRRDQVVIITKVGSDQGLAGKRMLQAAEASLKRLRTDRIDVYLAHKPDPRTPIEETLRAFEQLMQQGKVRAIGSSNDTGARMADRARRCDRADRQRDHPRAAREPRARERAHAGARRYRPPHRGR